MTNPSYYQQFQDFSLKDLNSRLNLACEKGWIEEVNYLLTSLDLLIRPSINHTSGDPLQTACKYGKLEVVKYLLTSPNLNEHANLHIKDDIALGLACKHGHLEIVHYLITSNELKEHADISAGNYRPIAYACHGGHLNVIQYLLASKDLKEKSNIHLDCDMIFRILVEKRDTEALKHIIFDLNIDITDTISECLEYVVEPFKSEVKKMFELRDLNSNLKNNLSINQIDSKRIKL
jgi:ankyrin repeat protein